MPKLQQLRTRVFHAQHGRCHYCGISMWLDSPDELPPPRKSVRARQCTAEHLVARQDGGRATAPQNEQDNEARNGRADEAPEQRIHGDLADKEARDLVIGCADALHDLDG